MNPSFSPPLLSRVLTKRFRHPLPRWVATGVALLLAGVLVCHQSCDRHVPAGVSQPPAKVLKKLI